MARRNFRQQAREHAEGEARELERQVRALAESQWHEPVVAVYLDYPAPTFEMPGLRKDGTIQVKGKGLVREILGKIFQGTVGALLALLVGDWAGSGKRAGRIAGPANAQALGLVKAAQSAQGPSWLVYSARSAGNTTDYSPSHVALVASGLLHDPADNSPLTFVWHVTEPHTPLISPEGQRLTWPDGSVFEYRVGDVVTPLIARSLLR